MNKTSTYKATKSKGDYPSVSSRSGTTKWDQMSKGAGVEGSTVVKNIDSDKRK